MVFSNSKVVLTTRTTRISLSVSYTELYMMAAVALVMTASIEWIQVAELSTILQCSISMQTVNYSPRPAFG